MNHTYPKAEKLKSKKLIEALFSEGKSVSAYPLRMVYIKTHFEDDIPCKVGVSVSKKRFKKAVDRNHIKRLLREAYRLNKWDIFNNIDEQYAFMILYIGKDKLTFHEINDLSKKLFSKFLKHIHKD
ncbi:ribonuclease P protein component [Mangrovimonas sp. AS39]|uniref:ribonuclease P protein component n=1 Tax=Mangrovimonas TaxID=1211036 RepID=UPI00141DA901|nr:MULTISPECIES: ribonuclease P protein component [Mangrovimonas]MCF1190377.1 ribonuclease P protein component [Mangrovimonas futianensis]MCF1193870.1 ribonuclease P protein component [Mangrovimonas futianensis]NIK90926.1 ribonuclease P protein component [Mangrovimonas sp. CR14]